MNVTSFIYLLVLFLASTLPLLALYLARIGASAGAERGVRLLVAIAAGLLAILTSSAGRALGQAANNPVPVNVGSQAVGTAQTQTTITFQVTTAGTMGTPLVLTLGQPNLDYTLGTGSTCTGSVQAGSCTVNVLFAPKYAGQRLGAVELVSISNTVLATAMIYGTGIGPEATFTPGTISTEAGTSYYGFSGDGGAAASAPLYLPNGVTVDGAGNLYIADGGNNRIRKVTAKTGIISTVAGNGTPGSSGDGGAATSALLNTPSSVVVDGAGNLYIADQYNQCIRKVTAATGIISTVAGTEQYFGYSGDGGAATSAELYFPADVAVDGADNLYIADEYNHRIRKVTAATGVISTVAGNGTEGFSGDGGAANSAEMHYPTGVTVDGAGNLYIADEYNHRIRKVTAATGVISTVAGNGAGGWSGDGGAATSAGLYYPFGVTVDGAGNLYIADQVNLRIRKVAAETGSISTVAGNGTEGFSGDGGAATSAGLFYPVGVAVDGAGNLYIADQSNQRIRKVTAAAAALSFATTPPGSTSSDSPQTVTVNSIGTSALTFSLPASGGSASISSGFSIGDGSTCPQLTSGTLASGASCTYVVSFTPVAGTGGSVSGTLTLTDDTLNVAGSTQSIPLSGTVLKPVGNLEEAVDATTTLPTVAEPDTLSVSGWVGDPVDGSPLSNVKVYIDGVSAGVPTLGIARPDVASSTGNSAYANSGYTFTKAASTLAVGPHAVTVVAIDSSGQTTTFGPLSITVTAYPNPVGNLEKAVDASTKLSTVVQPDPVFISGWAADPTDGSPLSNVKVYIDGVSAGVPTLGIARPDVASSTGNSAYANSGYTLSAGSSTLAPGTHAVTVVAENAHGLSTTFGPLSITVPYPSPVGNLEKAVDASTKLSTVVQPDPVFISGWAADPTDGSPLSNVKVYIDGVSAGVPTLGIARPDVASSTGNSAYANSGYTLSTGSSTLTLGAHAVTVVAENAHGVSTTFGPQTLTVGKVPVGDLSAPLDTSTLSTTISLADTMFVYGWAADYLDNGAARTVTVAIDGRIVGTAAEGQPSSDVAAAYSNPAWSNVRYNFTIAASSLGVGTHTLAITATDSLGLSTTLGPLTFTIQ